MIKFVKKISLVAVTVIFIIASVILYTNIKINNSPVFKLSKNVKYIILGHSHPELAFNDSLINSTKNVSQSGELYFYTYIKAKKLLSENKQIKTVFLEFTNNEIINDMEKWTTSEEQIMYRIPKYAPIMNKEDYQYIIPKNPIAFIEAMPIVFRNNINSIYFKSNSYLTYNDLGHYYYSKRQHVDSLLKVNQQNLKKNDYIEINKIDLVYLDKIIEFCKKKHVEICLIRSPFHKKEPVYTTNEKKFKTILNTLYAKQTFLDFKDFPLLNEDYGDLDHLNYKGARKFSLFFNDLLKHGLLQKADKQAYINHQMKKQL